MVRRIRACGTCHERFVSNFHADIACDNCRCSSDGTAASTSAPIALETKKKKMAPPPSLSSPTMMDDAASSSLLYEEKEEEDDDDDDDQLPLMRLLMQQQDQNANTTTCNNNNDDNRKNKTKKVGDDDNNTTPPIVDDVIDLLLDDDDDDDDDNSRVNNNGGNNEEEEDENVVGSEAEEDGLDDSSDDDDEPILVDFQEERDDSSKQVNTTLSSAAAAMPVPVAFQAEQDRLHSSLSSSSAKKQPPHPSTTTDTTSNSSNNKDQQVALSVCFICGASLIDLKTGYPGRLNHIKRCSKKYGVTAKDVRYNDDHELFVASEETPALASTAAASSSSTTTTTTVTTKNPYLRKKLEWHGDANKDLDVASTAAPPATSTAAAAPTTKLLPSAHQLLMAGARRAAKTAQIIQKQKQSQNNNNNKKRKRSGGGNTFRRYNSKCPSYKIIPGTDFCCDGFQYNNNEGKNYFLTHFHADHYGGITKGWNAGVIYCSVPTANLVHQQLGVDKQYLHPLPMLTPTVVASTYRGAPRAVTVTLLHANHCPGAVMFLFEVGNRVILHVGDFRWNYGIMSNQTPLRPYCRLPWTNGSASEKRIDDLFLDTTYCDPRYTLPTQAECIQGAIEAALEEVKSAQTSKSRLLILFGAYTIGKEAVYMSVAEKLGMKVYVDQRRKRILSALDWSREKLSLLTTNPQETILWVVPLGHINMKRLVEYQSIHMKSFTRDFDRVVGFRPTGWSLTAKNTNKTKGASVVGTARKGALTVHSVPYSEHSAFPELVECLECLNPKRIIPTVSVSKSQQQIDLLMQHWRDKQNSLL